MSSFEIHHVLRDIGPGSKNETSTVASLHHLYALVSGVSITKLLPAVAVLYICGVASLALYRLYFHPISQFPGPRIAAVTGWYQAYYDIWKGGKMTQNIALLHEKYGPIVRIAPNRLHFNDPEEYSKIYSVNTKFTKDPFVYTAFNVDQASFGMIDPHVARGRRVVLNPLFSRRSAINLQWLVQEKFNLLHDKLVIAGSGGAPVDLLSAFRSTSLDIISAFCFAQSLDSLEVEGFRSPLLVAMEQASGSFRFAKHFPRLNKLMANSPRWMAVLFSPSMAALFDVRKTLGTQIEALLANPDDLKNAPHPIIYSRLLDPTVRGADAAPPTRRSLQEEAQVLMFAGSDTVAYTLITGVFHIFENPTVHERLFAELVQAWPVLGTTPSYEELEKLPYLAAVVKESLRMGNGVVAPLPRYTPEPGVVISGEFIPAGTVVMMSAPIVHANEKIFPDSETFKPERWMQGDTKHLENYLVAFSKGSRQCLGINLAYCELYIGFATIFRKLDIKLDNTRADMDWEDYFVPRLTGKNLEGTVGARTS